MADPGSSPPPPEPASDSSELAALRRRLQELSDTETRFKLAVEAAGIGVWEWRLETNEMVYSLRAKEICGFPAGEPVTYEMVASVTHPDDLPRARSLAARALDPAVRARELYEYRIVRPDGLVRWVRAHGEAIFDEAADPPRPTRYVGTIEDITEPRAAHAALQASEARLRLALGAGRMAVWAIDASGRVEATPEFLALLHLPPDSHPSLEELQSRYYPGELERLGKLAQEALARGDRLLQFEYRHLWPDGEVRWLLVRAELVQDAMGANTGAIGVVLDITERHDVEDRLELLAREVDHRANNLLATVLAAISMTEGADTADFKERLKARVSALARAHQLLASSRWAGADLHSLIHEEMAPYEGRVQVAGPATKLKPPTAQGLSMVMHELATNAVKYGALSNQAGRVSISWQRIGPSSAEILWQEHGGPPVSPPSRRGMGSRVIQRALPAGSGQKTELDWRPEGLVCRIFVETD